MGSLIKILTGNLDHDDAIKFDKLIGDLRTQQRVTSKKISIITEIMGSFANISEITKKISIQLDKEIWEIRKLLNETISNQTSNRFIHIYSLFLHNFQMIFVKLDEIETTLAFSKLKTLHQSIIDADEFYAVLKNIEKTEKLPYSVDYRNLFKIEQSVELKAYCKENQITFIVEIPLVESDTYDFYRVFPLPVINNLNKTVLIIPKHPYLIANGSKTFSVYRRCQELERSLFLCYEDAVVPEIMMDTCVADLIKFTINTTSCTPVPVKIDEIKIELIQPNRWILYSKVNTLLMIRCGNEVSRKYIRGTYIATIDTSCSTTIGNVILKRHHTKDTDVNYSKLPIIGLPEILTPTTTLQWKLVDVDDIWL